VTVSLHVGFGFMSDDIANANVQFLFGDFYCQASKKSPNCVKENDENRREHPQLHSQYALVKMLRDYDKEHIERRQKAQYQALAYQTGFHKWQNKR